MSKFSLFDLSAQLVKMNFFSTVFFVYISFSVCTNGAYPKQLPKLELESTEDSNDDVDASRVLMNDESQTFLDRLLETFKLKRNSEPEAAESKTKEVEVTDEDWLTTMVKDLDKFVTALGEDVDFGLEEGSSESASKTDKNRRQTQEAGIRQRVSRGIRNLRNTNSRGHKMATDLKKLLRTRRNTIGTNKAGLVFLPNNGKGKKMFNRAGIAKRETTHSKSLHTREHAGSVFTSLRKQRNVNRVVGTNKAGLAFLPKQDKSKAGSTIVEVIMDDLSKSNTNQRNTIKKQEPKFSLVHRRQLTLNSDNPNFFHEIKSDFTETSGNQIQSSNKHNSEQLMRKKLESNQNGAVNSENHAPTLPLLSSSNSETSNSGKESPITNLSSKIPGIPNNVIPSGVRADGGISPTAVIGGFTMMLMPMPEMSLSNVQNMLQTGQQFSQLLPALPSIPS